MSMRRIWNKGTPLRIRLRVWWARLWVRRDEFHRSLSLDAEAMSHMCDCERKRYALDLAERRLAAHEADLTREG